MRLLGAGTILLRCSPPPSCWRRTGGVCSEVECHQFYRAGARGPHRGALESTASAGRCAGQPCGGLPERHVTGGGGDGLCAGGTATDCVHIEPRYEVLGTDGFGRSDTRSALRDFFEVGRHHIVLAALASLARQGAVEAEVCAGNCSLRPGYRGHGILGKCEAIPEYAVQGDAGLRSVYLTNLDPATLCCPGP